MATRRTTRTTRAATKSTNVIDIDFDGYTPSRQYMGEEPVRGVYRFKLSRVSLHEKTDGSGSQSILWSFELQDAPYKGWIGRMYTGLPGSEGFFRTQDIVRAIQGTDNPKPVKLDLDNPEKFIKAAKIVLGKVNNEEYKDEIRANLRTVAPDDPNVKSTKPLASEEEDDEDYEELDEDEELEDEDEDEEDEDEDDEDLDDEDEDDDEDSDEEDEEEDEEDDEDDEEEEEEPEPAPRRTRRSSSAKAAPAKKSPAKKATARRARR